MLHIYMLSKDLWGPKFLPLDDLEAPYGEIVKAKAEVSAAWLSAKGVL